MAAPSERYAGNQAHAVRGYPLEAMPGGPVKMATAIIEAGEADPAPARLCSVPTPTRWCAPR
jgi:hypothetical protein